MSNLIHRINMLNNPHKKYAIEGIQEHLINATGFGFCAIQARIKLRVLNNMSDNELDIAINKEFNHFPDSSK